MQEYAIDPSLKLLIDALAQSPDNAPLRMHVAAALERLGRPTEAAEHFDRAVTDSTLGVEALLGAARCYLAVNDTDAAMARISTLLDQVPENAMGLLMRARVHERHLRHGPARKDYERAVALDPSLADMKLWDTLVPSTGQGPDGANAPEAAAGGASNAPGGGITFAHVGGLEALKERIRMKIVHPFANPEVFKAFGKRPGGGMLFYGPPGCGKTFLARATAGECGAHFTAVGLHEVLEMWVGSSERRLHAVFEEARRRAPSVLFFDEVDALGMQRSKLTSSAMRGVITQFLAELDGFQGRNERVLVIGATNTPWDLDPAFRRPGRFDQVLFVPPPDHIARVEILRLKLADKPHDTVDLERLAVATEGWSGADLEHLVDHAAEQAIARSIARGVIEPISQPLLEASRARLRPTTREWFSAAKNYAQYANEAGQYDDIADYMRRHNLGG